MASPEEVRDILLNAVVKGRAMNILWRAVAGEKIQQDDQDFFHDWQFETSTPEFFKAVETFSRVCSYDIPKEEK